MTRTIQPLALLFICAGAVQAQGLPAPGQVETPARAESPFVGTWALRGSTTITATQGGVERYVNTRVRVEVRPDPAGGLVVERRWRVTLPGNTQRATTVTARGVKAGASELRFEVGLEGEWVEAPAAPPRVEGLTGAVARTEPAAPSATGATGVARTVRRTNRLLFVYRFDEAGTTLREEVWNTTRLGPEHFWSASRCEGTRLTEEDLKRTPSRVTVVNHGLSSKRYDLTIVSEGYTPDELPVFHRDARECIERLKATTPFKEYWRYINIHRVDIVSARAGLAHGERGALGTTMPAKTPWAERLARWNGDRIESVAPGSDAVLVLADDDFRSAAAERFCVTSVWPDDVSTYGLRWGSSRLAETAVHELGHTIGRLLDEYDSAHPYGSHDAPSRWTRLRNGFEELGLSWTGWGGNVTSDPGDVPWSKWLGTPGVGAHEGAYHQARGWYRPTANCMMRDTGAEFCVVCREQLVKRLSRRSFPIQVAKTRLDANTWSLRLYPQLPGKAKFRWLRNGFEVGTGSTFLAKRADTWHQDQLTCDVKDLTPWVKNDPDGDTTFRVRFQLTRRADLRLEGPAFE
jgi:hypothetical protein